MLGQVGQVCMVGSCTPAWHRFMTYQNFFRLLASCTYKYKVYSGFAHNLTLESSVSRLAMLEKLHPKTNALTLDDTYNYHMLMEAAREQRQRAALRSKVGGGAREAARDRDDKPLIKPNRSKAQQQALVADMLERATAFKKHDARLHSRGVNSLASACKARREAYKALKDKVVSS